MPETVESQIKINLRERLGGKNSLSFERKKKLFVKGECVSKKNASLMRFGKLDKKKIVLKKLLLILNHVTHDGT